MILLDRLASREDAKVRCKMCLCARWGSLIRDSICIDEGSSTTNATPPRRCQGGRDVPPRRVWLPYFSLLVDRDHRLFLFFSVTATLECTSALRPLHHHQCCARCSTAVREYKYALCDDATADQEKPRDFLTLRSHVLLATCPSTWLRS